MRWFPNNKLVTMLMLSIKSNIMMPSLPLESYCGIWPKVEGPILTAWLQDESARLRLFLFLCSCFAFRFCSRRFWRFWRLWCSCFCSSLVGESMTGRRCKVDVSTLRGDIDTRGDRRLSASFVVSFEPHYLNLWNPSYSHSDVLSAYAPEYDPAHQNLASLPWH